MFIVFANRPLLDFLLLKDVLRLLQHNQTFLSLTFSIDANVE
jgi:hypothetical protein